MKNAATATLVLLMTSCAHQAPSINEPHTRVVLRSRHQTQPGPELQFSSAINGHKVSSGGTMDDAGFLVRETRMKPGKNTIKFSSSFGVTRYETRWQTTYTTQTYTCGYMNNMPQTCTRQVPHQSMTSVPIFTPQASCEKTVNPEAFDGDTVIVEYEFQSDGVCDLRFWVEEETLEPEEDGLAGLNPR